MPTKMRIVGAMVEILRGGEPGEVAIRGANVFAGYENDADADAAQFRDTWFHTGDFTRMEGRPGTGFYMVVPPTKMQNPRRPAAMDGLANVFVCVI